MAEPLPPTFDDLSSLSPADVRTALLARGIGLSEAEVEQALALLLEESADVGPRARGGRLTLTSDDGALRAGGSARTSAPNPAALDFAIDWFARTFFVGG